MNLNFAKSKMQKCQDVPSSYTKRYEIRYTIDNSPLLDVDFDLYFDWMIAIQHKFIDNISVGNKSGYLYKSTFKRPQIADINAIIGEPIFPGSITIVTGESGTGKTTFLLQAFGEHAFNRKVGYVSGEQNIGFLQQICKRCSVLNVDVGNIVDIDDICEIMSDYKMLVIDSFPCLQYNVEKYGKMTKLAAEEFMLNKLAQTAQEVECALFIVLHSTKAGQYKGSTFFKHTVDNMITLKKENGRVAVYLEKSRIAPPPPQAVYLTMGNTGFDEIRTYVDLDNPITFPIRPQFAPGSVIEIYTNGAKFKYVFDKAAAIHHMLTENKTSLIYKLSKKSLQHYYIKHPNEPKDSRLAKLL